MSESTRKLYVLDQATGSNMLFVQCYLRKDRTTTPAAAKLHRSETNNSNEKNNKGRRRE